MIIYNVTVKVQRDSADAWVSWMKTEHIASLMATGLFTDCRLCRLLEQDETEDITYTAQYSCKSMNEYNAYISDHAAKMRDEGLKRFEGKFVAFRTVMEVM